MFGKVNNAKKKYHNKETKGEEDLEQVPKLSRYRGMVQKKCLATSPSTLRGPVMIC